MARTTHNNRSVKLMRDRGYNACNAECCNAFGRRDLFGVADVVAFNDHETVWIQATSKDNLSHRKKKAYESDALRAWMRGKGRRFLVHGWFKDGRLWKCKEVELEI